MTLGATHESFRTYRPGWEAIDQPLYDFNTYSAPGVRQLEFFAMPIGERGKTDADTNMPLASTLPRSQEFLIRRLAMIDAPPAVPSDSADHVASMERWAMDADRRAIMWGGAVELVIGAKTYLRLPLLRLVTEPFELAAPLRIPESSHFGVHVVWRMVPPPIVTKDVRIGLELRGLLYRRSA